MKRLLILLLLACLAAPRLAAAALEVGAPAPAFSAPAALAGKSFTFDMADALRRGPVVVYFYPAAFTSGCTIEAHNFAEAADDYRALGASIIGVSGDDMQTLAQFSVSACGGKFPVASDHDHSIMKAYDAYRAVQPGKAARISYVVTPDGKVLFVHDNPSPHEHVAKTLEAVRRWRQAQ